MWRRLSFLKVTTASLSGADAFGVAKKCVLLTQMYGHPVIAARLPDVHTFGSSAANPEWLATRLLLKAKRTYPQYLWISGDGNSVRPSEADDLTQGRQGRLLAEAVEKLSIDRVHGS